LNPASLNVVPPLPSLHIKEFLSRRRASLSASASPKLDEEYRRFLKASARIETEAQAMSVELPIIEGNFGQGGVVADNLWFNDLDHLTDGLITRAKPDRCHGADDH
jgi:hypothetical protein